MIKENRCPVKTMRLHLSEGERLVPFIESASRHSSVHIYNLVFEAEAFLYKLIRRITGTLVHMAKGQMTKQDVLDRFSCPPDYYDSALPMTLKPNGLFLYEVKYNEQDFQHPPILKGRDSSSDNINDIIMEIQEDDENEDDHRLNSTMIAVN